MFDDLDKAIISATLAGKSLLLFRPKSPWGNGIAPDRSSRPLEVLRVRAARNSRAVAVFAAANLTDKPFFGQFKVTAEPHPDSGKPSTDKHLLPAANCYISQGFALADRAGRALCDPIMPLTLNSVLRLAPKESVPIYLEIDTHGLSSGIYHATLALKKAMPGFADLPRTSRSAMESARAASTGIR